MAESLQCPSCGARTRVGSPAPDTITCGRCGRGLKLSASSGSGAAPPPRTRRRGGVAAPPAEPSSSEAAAPRRPARVVASDATAPPAPSAPRRRRGRAEPGAAVLDVSSMPGAVSVPAPPVAAAGPVVIGATGVKAPPTRRPGDEAPSRVLRVAAWVVALPIALLAVGIPAREAGYLTGQKLLDVIVKRDLGRFVPLLVIVALWALVTAVLVTLFLAAAARWSHRRDGSGAGLAAADRSDASRSRSTS